MSCERWIEQAARRTHVRLLLAAATVVLLLGTIENPAIANASSRNGALISNPFEHGRFVVPPERGRNAGGAMVLHVDNSISYTEGVDYCAEYPLPPTCGDLTTSVTTDPGIPAVIWMVAAFPDNSSPAVVAFQVGIDGDVPRDLYAAFSNCGMLEIPDETWPAPGTGTAVAFASAVHDRLFKMYWFAVSAPGSGSSIRTVHYPHRPDPYAAWADDSDPPVLDICYNFGRVVWGGGGQNTCPQPLEPGACCFADGRCAVLMQYECEEQGGAYQGDATACDPNPCPQPGACCFGDGRCTVLFESECLRQGGTYRGDGSTCDPNPCPQLGACCFHDGHCELLLEAKCQAHGGVFWGPGSACVPNPCPPPTGACCFADGHCAGLSQADCAQQGGGYQGDDTICDPNPCPQPGACCFADGHCAVLQSIECQRQGGVYQGDGTVCVPNPCPQPGACCFTDGHCTVLLRAECEQQGGTFRGEGTSCTPNPCPQPPTGACCFDDGHCEVVTQAICEQEGGIYRGDETSCEPNPCPQPPTGACCFHDGHCEVLAQVVCQRQGGVYQGDETSCEPNPCPQPGACCFYDGHCTVLLADECQQQGGDYQGDGTNCNPNLCPQPPTGACCYHDGHCEVHTAAVCQQQGGDYQGDGTSCYPNPCPPPGRGACCFSDGHCEIQTEADCARICGSYQGDGTTCNPNPCRDARSVPHRSDRPTAFFVGGGSPKSLPSGNGERACWSEPPDVNGLIGSSEQILAFGLETELANDFSVDRTSISRATWWGGYWNNSAPCDPGMVPTGFNLRFYADAGCLPGAIVADISLTSFDEECSWCQQGYYPLYKWSGYVDLGIVPNELYWFGAQMKDHPFPPQSGRLAAMEITGCDTMFKSVYFSYPDWTPSIDVFGVAFDASQEFDCGYPTKTVPTTWGAIKQLYR